MRGTKDAQGKTIDPTALYVCVESFSGMEDHKVIVNGKPKAGVTKMGFKGKGGRPADQPPKANPYFGGQQQQVE